MFIVTLSQDGDGEDYTDIIEEYERRGLHIRHINSETNNGPGVARQKGFDSDKMCDYVIFLDADDMLFPNAVDTLYTEVRKNNLDILVSEFVAERKHQPNVLLEGSRTTTWLHNKIYRAQYLRDNNIRFRDDMRLNEDAYFNLVAVNCTQNKMKIPECTHLWRDNPKSITRIDKKDGFFRKSYDGYVYSQVKGIEKIIEITGEINNELLAATLIQIYRYFMICIYKKLDMDKITTYVNEFKTIREVQEILDDFVFWKYIQENLHASEFIENDHLIFYDIKFSTWLKEYIKKD